MIRRLPKWAENEFANQFVAAGGFAHPPLDQDYHGWDRLLEFPPENHPGPADTHPPPKSAYAQVKSTTRNRLTCRLKLSNALKAAQSMQPWFLILMVVDSKTSRVATYAVHLWENFIRNALKRVRMAENTGEPLNRRSLTITFSEADRHDCDLVAWMQNCIAEHEPDYQKKKQELYKSVGYEDGDRVGTVSISASSFEEMANNLLGLGDGLRLSKFTVTPWRFGVMSPKPEVDYSGEGKLVITPNPVDTCEVRLRANDTSYSLKGQVFALGQPFLRQEDARFRFSAEFFELVIDRAMTMKNFITRFEPDTKYKLRTLEAFASLVTWGQKSIPIDVQIWTNGRRLAFGTMSLKFQTNKVDWERLAVSLRNLRGLSVGNEDNFKLSLHDVLKAGQRLVVLAETAYAPSMRLEVDNEGSPAEIDSLIFYSFADVGDYLLYALCECELTEDVLLETRRRLTFGPTKRIDSYVFENPTAQQKEQMEKDFRRYLENREKQTHPIGIGDVLTFSQGQQHSEAA
jgi:hypothetical protein